MTPDLQVRYTTASRERLSAITSTGYEAELHSRQGALDGVEAFWALPSTAVFAKRPRNSTRHHRGKDFLSVFVSQRGELVLNSTFGSPLAPHSIALQLPRSRLLQH